jgi:hypothetical protein
VQKEFGTFHEFFWSFVGGKTVQNRFVESSEIPAVTPQAEAMSKALLQRGFTFVGRPSVMPSCNRGPGQRSRGELFPPRRTVKMTISSSSQGLSIIPGISRPSAPLPEGGLGRINSAPELVERYGFDTRIKTLVQAA